MGSAAARVLLVAYVTLYAACLSAYVSQCSCVDTVLQKMLLVLLFVVCACMWGTYEVSSEVCTKRNKYQNVWGWLLAYFVVGSGAVLVLVS
jgi:hypothetical protein